MGDKWLHARVGEQEYAAVKHVADTEQRSLSQAVRILLAEAIEGRQQKEESRP